MSCEFYLFSDHQSYTNITIFFNMNSEGLSCSLESLMSCSGEWYDDNNQLKVIPDVNRAKTTILSINSVVPEVFKGQWLSAYERSILEAELNKELANFVKGEFSLRAFLENGEIPIENFKKNMGMRFGKTEVKTPFYYVEPENNPLTIMDIDDTPDPDLVRCYYKDTPTGQFHIGLYHRVFFDPCYYCTYKMDGSYVTSFDEGLLSREEREKERIRCNEYVDSELRPESGQAKFTFIDGSVYDGQWSNKLPSGTGYKTLKDGSWLRGNWQDGILVDGKGELKLPKGTYEGDIKNDKMTGQGVMTVSGGTYNGQWEDGVFKTGTITKKQGYSSDQYIYYGSINGSSFLEGRCEYGDGSVFDGQWDNMKITNGTFSTPTNDWNYPVFEGEIKNGKLDKGRFANRAGYAIVIGSKVPNSNDGLTIAFPNGDQCKGTWDDHTGQLVPASLFEYIWADGVRCRYVVDKKLRLTKPSYYDSEGNPAKSKIAKKRELMNIDGEGYTIQTMDVKPVVKSFNNKNTELP